MATRRPIAMAKRHSPRSFAISQSSVRISEQTLETILRKVRGVRRPRKSGTEERPLPLPKHRKSDLGSSDFDDSSRRCRTVRRLHSIDCNLANVIEAVDPR